jgi:hypothetical protein
MLKKDNFALGIVLGLIAPILGMIIYYFVSFYKLGASLSDFLYLMFTNKKLLTGISSISLVANAIVFTLYFNAHRDKTVKGIFVATLTYAVAVLLYKMIA